MAVAGFSTTVKVGGTATALSNEACTKVTANTVYQITDATKRALDPDTTVVVEVDADGAGAGAFAVAGASYYSLDYCSGTITFGSDQGADAVVRVASGKYIPLLSVAEAHAADVTYGYESVATPRFGDTGKRSMTGRAELSGSLEHWHSLSEDLDSGGGTRTFGGSLAAPVFVEIHFGGTGDKMRGWVQLKSNKVNCKLTEAVGHSVNFEGVVRTCADRPATEQALFGWSS